MPEQNQLELEICCLCGCPTERAGRADDSIYSDVVLSFRIDSLTFEPGNEVGPLCVECWQALNQLMVIDDR